MNTVDIKINKLKAVAKVNGLEVRFSNHKTNMGDFCIFIYDKSVRKSYMVGYDGDWNSDSTKIGNFDNCLKCAYRWIEKRDSRYEMVNGKWVLKGN
jgi:hypothetical protein